MTIACSSTSAANEEECRGRGVEAAGRWLQLHHAESVLGDIEGKKRRNNPRRAVIQGISRHSNAANDSRTGRAKPSKPERDPTFITTSAIAKGTRLPLFREPVPSFLIHDHPSDDSVCTTPFRGSLSPAPPLASGRGKTDEG